MQQRFQGGSDEALSGCKYHLRGVRHSLLFLERGWGRVSFSVFFRLYVLGLFGGWSFKCHVKGIRYSIVLGNLFN